MKIHRNVYIVHGPFQLFNCCEARHRFHKNEHNILIFIDRGEPRNREQTLRILEKEPFDELHHIPFKSLPDKYLYPARLRGLLREIAQPNKLYVSLYRNISSHIINSIQPSEVVMYDDGNRTLSATHRIFEKDQPRRFRIRAKLAKLLGRKLDLGFTRTATYFSLYELPSVPAEIYLKNDYRYYKNSVATRPTSDHVDFLGSKVIGYGIDEKTFESLMHEVIAFYRQQGKSLRYITHRSEPLDYLEKVALKLGFELVNLSNIIEVAYAQADALPSEIATFRTAAVSNLHTIFDLPVRIFEIPQERLESSTRENLKIIYKNFREQGFTIEQPLCAEDKIAGPDTHEKTATTQAGPTSSTHK